MTTITIEIDKDKDLNALKSYLSEAGYRFEVAEEDVQYTPEFKQLLDQRYEDYKSGKMPVVSAEESQKSIKRILDGDI